MHGHGGHGHGHPEGLVFDGDVPSGTLLIGPHGNSVMAPMGFDTSKWDGGMGSQTGGPMQDNPTPVSAHDNPFMTRKDLAGTNSPEMQQFMSGNPGMPGMGYPMQSGGMGGMGGPGNPMMMGGGMGNPMMSNPMMKGGGKGNPMMSGGPYMGPPGMEPSFKTPFDRGDEVHRVDWANFAGMDVTGKMNQLIEANGLEDCTAGQSLLQSFGEPARGRVRILKVAKGAHSLSFEEDNKLADEYDLTPLFEDRSWKQERGAQGEALDAADNQMDPIEAWVMGFGPDGARRVEKWANDPNYTERAPDGTLVDAGRALAYKKAAEAPELAPSWESEIKEWYVAANVTHFNHQQMLASRHFTQLCAQVDLRKMDPNNPEGMDTMWTNDPKVFPMPKELRAEGAQGLAPWEQGVMAYPPDQRQYFVPPKLKDNTYSIDVYIGEWMGLFEQQRDNQRGPQPASGPRIGGRKIPALQYKLFCTTGKGDNATTIVETDMVDPKFHNGFFDFGSSENYELPEEYMLPDCLDSNVHPPKMLNHYPQAEQEKYGLEFLVCEVRYSPYSGYTEPVPIYRGFIPPHIYYDWKQLKGYEQFLMMKERKCQKWVPVYLTPVGASPRDSARDRSVGSGPPPMIKVHVTVYAGTDKVHKPSFGESCTGADSTHGGCCGKKNKGGEIGQEGAPEEPEAQEWDLEVSPGDDSGVFGPLPGGTIKKNSPRQVAAKQQAAARAAEQQAPSRAPITIPKPLKESPAERKTWCRLTEFGHSTAERGFAVVFDAFAPDKSNCGRVLKGELDNMYFIEALNAISCRPKLAKSLFYNWDVSKSIYSLRMMCNGTWIRVEIDDYVAPRLVAEGGGADSKPSCAYSQHFPYVLWPSLVEKAYAKIHTVRPPYGNSGGWQAVGGGGRVEEAMADLTGGVAGRFSTKDVSFDRLFLYFYRLQRYCIWVARAHRGACEKHGVQLDMDAAYVVNRAAPFQGESYIQLYNAGMGSSCIDGAGLQTYSVPFELIGSFPEKPGSGYFWVNALDFDTYFDQILECRLTNSPDVGLKDMPGFPMVMHLNVPPAPGSKLLGPKLFKETVVANKGILTAKNPPEFEIFVPGAACPCEISAVLEQGDPRSNQLGASRPLAVPLLLKVYQETAMGDDNYSKDLVCKSNWLPVRDAMISFGAKQGGRFLVTCGFPNDEVKVHTLVFRVYSSCDGVVVTANRAMTAHNVTEQEQSETARAIKWTLVGCRAAHRSDDTEPEPYNPTLDGLIVPLDGQNPGCSIM